jgi:non-ribosomal peptide synthetase component F
MSPNGEPRSAAAFERMLEWNREVPPAVNAFVHKLIQAKADRDPKSQAICSWDGNLTYGELEGLSSRLASYLVTQGVGPEVIVPLCFEKSQWAIVGLLAVIKAGGVFLLLDPAQPIARLESLIKQTGASFALSSSACFDTCKGLVERPFVVDAASLLKLKWTSPQSSVKLSNAAYVIFTSGSTGTPKAVISRYSDQRPLNLVHGSSS